MLALTCFFGKPTVVKLWTPSFKLHDEVLRCVPIWVKFPNLPLHCWTVDSLSRIASTLGQPVCADECTSRQLRISFARVLVDIDITKELKQTIWIEDPDGNLTEQKVIYEWTPPFCKTCNKVGHDCATKRKPPPRNRQQGQQNQQWAPKATTPAAAPVPGATYVDTAQTEQHQQRQEPQVEISVAQPTYEETEQGQWKIVPRKRWHSVRTKVDAASKGSRYVLLEDLDLDKEEGEVQDGGGDDNPIPAP